MIRSPYLLGIGAWVSLLSFAATILYFEQAHIVSAAVKGAGAQTRVFASIDLAVGLLTLATQVFATGHLIKRFGTGIAAGALPAIYVGGLCRAVFGADARRRDGRASTATLDEFRHRQSGAPGVLHRHLA